MANAAAVQQNMQRVLVGAIAIEHQLESLIVDRTFEGETGSKLSFFVNNILAAEWFTFSAKRRLAVHIVSDQERLRGPEKGEFEQLLGKVIRYRNAMAHGRVVEKNDGTYLSYFESSPRETLLSDEYWEELERVFRRATELCWEALKLSRIPTG